MPSASICPPALVRSQSSWSIAGAHYKHWATSLGNFSVTSFFGGNLPSVYSWNPGFDSRNKNLQFLPLFARLSLSTASSICTHFFVRSVFYSRAILKSSQSLFASLSLCAASFFPWVCPMEHIICSSLHLPAIVHGGEWYFVQEDLLSHEYLPSRPSVSRTNSLV